jgi:DNA-binding response OmpR family regulator
MGRERRPAILIVEDDVTIARGLEELLSGDGYRVACAPTGEDALRRFRSAPPDAVLLDINLPGITGLDVCRRLRAAGFRRPVVFLTARGDPVDRVVGLDAGADDYIPKPFDGHEVLARIRAHIRADRAAGEVPVPGEVRRAAPRSGVKNRRLLAVMFTDMKDFSRRMNQDETRGLKVLAAHNQRITRAVRRAKGRIIENVGDSFLVSFESALRAVECASVIQTSFGIYNASRREPERILVRIGIHVGDVIEMSGRLRGDAVNIAARIQQGTPPGEIRCSGAVHAAVEGKTNLLMRRLGRRSLRNIRQHVMLYTVQPQSRRGRPRP